MMKQGAPGQKKTLNPYSMLDVPDEVLYPVMAGGKSARR